MSENSQAPVVVGVDGSESARPALVWAAEYAARHRRPLHLVYAIGMPVTFDPGFAGPVDNETSIEAAKPTVAEAAETARKAAVAIGELTVKSSVVVSAPIPELLRRSEEAHLVVVGSRGLGAFRRALLGSVSTALVRHAESPVAVIPETEPAPEGPVVVGVDGSPLSSAAIALAYEEAQARGAKLIAVHGWSELYRYVSRDEMQGEAEALVAENLAGYGERYPDVVVERLVEEERPAKLLLKAAESARLVVVGSHGRGGFPGMTLGSVSQAVLHGTDSPVIVVRPRPGATA